MLNCTITNYNVISYTAFLQKRQPHSHTHAGSSSLTQSGRTYLLKTGNEAILINLKADMFLTVPNSGLQCYTPASHDVLLGDSFMSNFCMCLCLCQFYI